jgi:hypothetical protein
MTDIHVLTDSDKDPEAGLDALFFTSIDWTKKDDKDGPLMAELSWRTVS